MATRVTGKSSQHLASYLWHTSMSLLITSIKGRVSYQRNSKSNFQGLIEKEGDFQGWLRKNYVEFSGVLVLHLRISKRSNVKFSVVKICFVLVWNFQERKVDKPKNSRGFSKKFLLNHLFRFFLEALLKLAGYILCG